MFVPMLLALAQPLPEIVRGRPRPPADPPAAQDVEAVPDAPPRAPEPEPLPRRAAIGDWSLGMARGGVRCSITLSDHRWGNGLATASLGPNCPEPLFAVTRWRLDGQTLTLADRSGRPVARLTPQDGGLSPA